MIKYSVDMVAIWVGTSEKPLDKWMKYTDGIDNPRRKPRVEKEFGGVVDIDLFGIYVSDNDEVIPIGQLIYEAGITYVPTDQKIVEQAHILGIFEGNRLYYYLCAEFIPEDPDKKYNDLTFIGNFNDEMPQEYLDALSALENADQEQ